MTRDEITVAVKALLAAESTMILGTVDGNAVVSSAPLFYVFDDRLALYWLSASDSRHSLNIVDHPQASVAVCPGVWHWKEIRGVQMEGVALQLDDPAERARVIGEYIARFKLGDEMSAAIDQSTVYKFRPLWVRYLDNSRGFGFKAETRL